MVECTSHHVWCHAYVILLMESCVSQLDWDILIFFDKLIKFIYYGNSFKCCETAIYLFLGAADPMHFENVAGSRKCSSKFF